MILARVSILATCLFFLACSEQFHYAYESGAVALSSDNVRRGWVPEWLPPEAADVHLQYDIDTNTRWLRFKLSEDARAKFTPYLRRMSEEEVMGLRIQNPRFANWWFYDLIQQQPAVDAALNADLFAGAGNMVPQKAVIAFERETQETFVYIPWE